MASLFKLSAPGLRAFIRASVLGLGCVPDYEALTDLERHDLSLRSPQAFAQSRASWISRGRPMLDSDRQSA
jgi:hypothetical protein